MQEVAGMEDLLLYFYQQWKANIRDNEFIEFTSNLLGMPQRYYVWNSAYLLDALLDIIATRFCLKEQEP
jgi:hypothetical protein